MDELKTVLEFVATVGVLPVLCYLLWRLLITGQKSLDDQRKRSDELVQKLAEIVSMQESNVEQRLQQFQATIELEIKKVDLLQDAIFKVDAERKQAIAENMSAIVVAQNDLKATTGALITFRDETVKAYERAVSQMMTAREKTVSDVNAHTTEAHRVTGEAITAARTENRETHAGQSEELETRMNNLQDAIEQNGKDRKAQYTEIQETLATMAKTLSGLQEDMKAVKAQTPGDKLTAISEKVDKLSDEFETLKEKLTPPAPLSPEALKSEELK